MGNLGVNNKKLTNELLMNWLKKRSGLKSQDRQLIYEIGNIYYGTDLSELYNIYEALVKGEKEYRDKVNNIGYSKEGELYNLIKDENKITLNRDNFRKLIITLIDILDKIYPLGTTVTLKKEYMDKLIGNKDIKEIKVTIIGRMQFFNGINSYFQYAGAIYPVGLVGDGRTIHFSTALIDKVLKEGYSDEQEEAYIYVVKEELLIDKNMNSFGFAPKEDLEEYKRRAMKNDKN